MSQIDVVCVGYRSENFLPRLKDDLNDFTIRPHHFHYFDNTGNPRTLPSLWNELAARGSARYLAIVNPDIALSPEWDERLIRRLESDPSIGLVTPDPTPFSLRCPSRSDMIALSRDRIDRADVGTDPVQFFAALMERKHWESLGGVDERMRFYMQDIDFIVRLHEVLRKRAVRVFGCPVWHFGSASTKAASERREMDPGVECDFGSKVFTDVRHGRLKQWHLLSEEEKKDVRTDGRYSRIPSKGELPCTTA